MKSLFRTQQLTPLILTTIVLGLLLGLHPATVLAKDKTPRVADQLLIQLNPLFAATVDDINATYGTMTLRQLTAVNDLYLLQTPPGADPKELAETMTLDLRLLFAEPNYLSEIPEAIGSSAWVWGGENEAPYGDQVAAKLLNLTPAHALSTGSGTIVAIVDTGVDLDHPALAAAITAGYDFVDGDDDPDDELNGDPSRGKVGGHGTHIAGIVHLVAPDARIMPLRVLGTDGQGDAFRVAEAVLFAVNNGANVINLSLGMASHSDTLKTAVRYATERGVVVVGAAGNLGNKEKQHPAATQCVLGVTAIDATRQKADFANYGSWVAYAAPGEAIYSAFPSGSYAWWSGTSMAAPFVAGQAALLRQLDQSINARDIALLIAHTSENLDTLNPDFAGNLGAGLPNITASLERLLSGDIPTSNRGIMSDQCVRQSS